MEYSWLYTLISGTGYSKLGTFIKLSPSANRWVPGWQVTPGFAGNDSPSFVFPTAIASKSSAGGSGSGRPPVGNKPSFLGGGGGASSHLSGKRGTEDLDFFIGDEALAAAGGPGYGINYPIRHGQIENWDAMERYWSNSIFKYLRVEPEDHYFLMTEPVRYLGRLTFLRAKADLLVTASESSRESWEHCRDHVRVV